MLATPTFNVDCSFNRRAWVVSSSPQAERLARELDIPLALAEIVASRVKPEEAHRFLNPSMKTCLPDPFHLKDMKEAADRLASAVVAGETVAVFGDYDVDGATSSALLARFFRALGTRVLVHIPDRMKEGYGPNAPALLALKQRGASVVITVDCGTMAFAPLEAAFEAGLDVIVVDHHQGEARKPKALAVVNPNRMDETSEHGNLAAVGVAFLLAVAVCKNLRECGYFGSRTPPDLMGMLDIVALGTVCDVVPLTKANRAFVTQGLKVLAQRRNTGLRALMDVARVEERVSAYHLGFILGPRINAGGRVGCAPYGSQLLSCDDEAEALTLARALDQYNSERQAIEAMVLEEAMAQAERQNHELPLILVCGEGWHPGVIGIVAGRIKERFHKPAAVVAFEGGIGKASARSVPGFDFGQAVIAALGHGLLKAGGGHAMAAGFTVEQPQATALHHFLLARLAASGLRDTPTLPLDGCLTVGGANTELAYLLERAGPYGSGNPQPRFAIRHAKVAAVSRVGQNHVRVILTDENKNRLPALAFRAAETPFGQALLGLAGRQVHAAGTLRLSHWQGREEASFTLEDMAWT